MTEPVFLVGLAIVGTTAVMVARAIAAAIAGRGASRTELAELRERLEEAQSALADQSAQLAELHERLDFAERVLAQSRDRPALGAGDKSG